MFLRPVLCSALPLLGDSSCGFHSAAPRPAQQHRSAAAEDDDDDDDDDDDEKMTILMNMVMTIVMNMMMTIVMITKSENELSI